MNNSEAMQIIDELSQLKFFPQSAGARAALASKLIDWCRGDISQARWLVDVGIQGLDEYPGPETLRKLIADEFRPAGNLQTVEIGIHTVTDCGECGDLGTRYEALQGRSIWCSCPQGQRIRTDMPDWLKLVNSKRITKSAQRRREENTIEILRNLTEGYGSGNEN